MRSISWKGKITGPNYEDTYASEKKQVQTFLSHQLYIIMGSTNCFYICQRVIIQQQQYLQCNLQFQLQGRSQKQMNKLENQGKRKEKHERHGDEFVSYVSYVSYVSFSSFFILKQLSLLSWLFLVLLFVQLVGVSFVGLVSLVEIKRLSSTQFF